MVSRKPAANGDLATYSRFRDRLLLGLATAVVALMGYFVHESQKQVDTLTVALSNLSIRLTADQNASSGENGRIGQQGAETMRRLDNIEKKLDTLTAAPRR
jgi:hypothetical protein